MRHLCTIAQFCRAISSQLRHVSTVRKKLITQQYVLNMSAQYGKLRPTIGWNRFTSLGHPCKFQRLSRLVSVTARQSSSERQPNFAAVNRGRHLCCAERPSRWALVHTSSFFQSTDLAFYWIQHNFHRSRILCWICSLFAHFHTTSTVTFSTLTSWNIVAEQNFATAQNCAWVTCNKDAERKIKLFENGKRGKSKQHVFIRCIGTLLIRYCIACPSTR